MRTKHRDPALVGSFGAPGDGPLPGVLALGGSDGGIPSYLLDNLVPEGFACLALAYHRGLAGADLGALVPEAMFELPLERVEVGLRWLIDQPNVATTDGRVALVGFSKGAELALLAAATFPDLVGPVVAYTPSSVAWQGFSWTGAQHVPTSTWSFGGSGVPFLPFGGAGPTFSDQGMRMFPMYDSGLDRTDALEDAAIRVERATGPILVVSGGDDAIWPAERMCRMLTERMERHGRGGDITHVHHPEAGHVLFEGFALSGHGLALGGSPEATRAAHLEVWPHVLATLRSTPGRPTVAER